MEQGSRPASGIPRFARLPIRHGSVTGSVDATWKPATIPVASRPCNAQEKLEKKRPVVGVAARTETTSSSRTKRVTPSESNLASKVPPSRCLPTPSSILPGTSGKASSQDAMSLAGDGDARESMSETPGPLPETPREKRRPRPSLSDRTIETISQIPPSPSSIRRRSSFFNVDTTSPMRPPPRPASAMSGSRYRPPSPTKRPPLPPLPPSLAAKSKFSSMPSKRSMTQPSRPAVGTQTNRLADYAIKSTTVGRKPSDNQVSSKPSLATGQVNAPQVRSSASTPLVKATPPRRKPPAAKSSALSALPKKPSPVSTATTATSGYQSRRSSTQSSQSCSTELDVNIGERLQNFSKSSVALRDAIAKAKKEMAGRKVGASRVCRKASPLTDIGQGIGSGDVVLGSKGTQGLIESRIKAALVSGHLNVAAMELTSIPNMVKRMYDVSEGIDVAWSECVDLTKFIAADNKFEKLDEDMFPDITDAELRDAEDTNYNGQLRGLETLDLHCNLLQELPLGLRRLQNLHSLNLSGNKLEVHAFGIICEIGDGLTELRMSDNGLSGMLPGRIRNLQRLQVLDLHGNKISELPEGLQELVHLKILDLSQNRLSSTPCEILDNLTLVELSLAGNRLSGILFPTQCSFMKTLKRLDVSNNALDAVAPAEIALPGLQTVKFSGNRFKTFPDISSWEELLTLAIAENVLSEMPPGLVSLKKLRNMDLSNNNITKINEGIASMENLVSVNLAGNPLRERKYLAMATADLKANLQKRGMGPDARLELDRDIHVSNSSTRGILDWSSRSLSSSNLPTPDLDDPITDIFLHHNSLNFIPASLLLLSSISESLKTLDISHNPLQSPYFTSPVTLPQLKNLSLASCHLKHLDGLITNLSAPALTTLNLSNNYLSGSLPPLRLHFRILTTLLASDNRFSTLEVLAVKGLTTLDIRNNEVDHLEPRLGLLGGKGKTGLQCLEVQGNKFRVPRWDVLEKGTEAVLGYLRGRVPVEELGDEVTGVEEDVCF